MVRHYHQSTFCQGRVIRFNQTNHLIFLLNSKIEGSAKLGESLKVIIFGGNLIKVKIQRISLYLIVKVNGFIKTSDYPGKQCRRCWDVTLSCVQELRNWNMKV